MGNSKSRGRTDKKRRRDKQQGNVFDRSESRPVEYDDPQLLLLKRTIETNPDLFILNNLMMCVQFFGNYEEEMKQVKEKLASSRETELNKRLPQQKHVLLLDVLQEHIAKNVSFTSTRQTFRPTTEPLQPVRIYAIHDNIDIAEQNYSPHYSSVNDSITYNILLKPTQHQGYVQLQLLDDFVTSKRSTKDDEVDLSSIAEDDDELYSDGDSVYGPKPSSNLSARSDFNRRPKQISKTSEFKQSRSLPNLYDEAATEVESRQTLTSSNRNLKVETDYYNGSSSEERRQSNKMSRSKLELPQRENRRWERQVPHSKNQGSATNQDHTSSNSSGYRSDNYAMDSDSSCNRSQTSRVSQSSSYEDIMDETMITNGKFPNRCFKRITYTAEGKVYDPKEDKVHLLNSKQRRIKLALRRHNYDLVYMSSTEFMKHFINLFVKQLADLLGFDRETVNDIRREGCVLYCDKIMVSSSFKHSFVEQYEIVPAVWSEWPICAQEWLNRSRSSWPDSKDVEKIKDFGCYVVPEGFVPKHGNNNLMEDLEWQLTFPTAERYLETCMTQTQVQVYLITLMLHKTFMRPIFDTMFSLTPAHIRHKLFWMIEENDRPSKWPDNAMGECLLSLLNSLYFNISQYEPVLKDYFITSRNLFQRVPCEHLLHTQKQLKRIIENPVMYIFHAMENIRYSDNFYPRLNYEMLLKILTADTLMLVNPTLGQNISRPTSLGQEERQMREEKYDKAEFWDTVRSQRNKIHLVTNKTLISPRKATDSVIEISTRCAVLEGPRLCALLDLFIRHFINIAERCNQYQAYTQKTNYLNHADRLSILLFEHPSFKDDARAYRDKIKVLRKKTTSSKSRDGPPETPKRNQETAIYVASLNNRFAQGLPNNVEPSTRQKSKEPDQNANRVQNVTKAIVHETHYTEPDEESEMDVTKSKATSVSTTNRNSTNESEASQSNNSKQQRSTVTFRPSLESIRDESTYI